MFRGTALWPAEDLLGARGNHGKARLAGRGARKIEFRPDNPRSHALVFGKRGVCAFDGRGGGTSSCILYEENSARLDVPAAIHGNDYTIRDARLFAKGGFQIFGINVQTCRRDDDIFLAPAEKQVALRVEFAYIPSAQPALLISWPNRSLFPVAARNIFATHQDFSVFGQLEFPARQNLPDRPLRSAKRVIQADQ